MNDALGPEGIVLSALFFDEFPPIVNSTEKTRTKLYPRRQSPSMEEEIVNHRIGERPGPFVVENFEPERKIVHVRDKPNSTTPFNIAQVKQYLEPSDLSHSFMSEIRCHLSRVYSTEEHTADEGDSVFLTEIIDPGDPRAHSKDMLDAVRKEVKCLFERGTFKVIFREEVTTNANKLPGRFVLAIKSTEDGLIKFKARFVIGGHRDKFKT
eukprot:IDg7230t1